MVLGGRLSSLSSIRTRATSDSRPGCRTPISSHSASAAQAMATPSAQSECYIGLISGTSTDGVDGVLADFAVPGDSRTLSATSLPMPQALRNELLALNSPGPNELDSAARAAVALARL